MTTELDKYFGSFSSNTQLAKFNRLQILFKAVLSPDNICRLLLQIKTLYNIEQPVTIYNYRAITDTSTNITKLYKKQIYKKQNRVILTGTVSQGKANLFGWIPAEDSQVYDKYISQPMQIPYTKNVISVNTIATDSPGLENIFVKELVIPVHKYYNLCKDNTITENYMSYELNLAPGVTFRVCQYYFRESYKHTVIMLECEFNEESRVLPEKLTRIKEYINSINHILAN